jgi:acyl-[acyl-carrier-protein]-phospholipid O-acyltransferase/long-chain-fatty-acid--[acyl-carrier-protein] ligase
MDIACTKSYFLESDEHIQTIEEKGDSGDVPYGAPTALFTGMTNNTGYGALLGNGGFQAFLWTQFLGAFNDNVYKMIVSVGAVELAANTLQGARYLALAGAVFVLPFLLFAGYAGQIADRFSKTRVLQFTKAFEIAIMLAGIAALRARSIYMLLVVLFLLAAQANMFSPAKYGILPEMLDEAQITRANGLLEFSTFAAIILGTSVGTFLFATWKDEPLAMGGMLLGIAVLGSAASIFIPRVPASGAREPFHANPFSDVSAGARRILGDRPLWLTVAGISYFWFTGALFQLTVILLGAESMHLAGTQTGLLVTALAIGIGLGSIAAGWLSGDRVEIGLVPCGAALLALCSIGVGMAHGYPQSAFWLAASGFAGGLFIVPLNAYLQEAAAPREKGRLLATNGFLNSIGILLASGVLYLLHDVLRWSPSGILIAVGVLTLAATILIAWTVPAALTRFIIWCLTRIFFRVRVIGADNIPKSGGALIVANHVSYADAVLIGCATSRQIRFLMWQPLYENKWLKPVCRLFESIPLSQGSAKEALRPLREARAVIESGQMVCIFPEGKLTATSHVQPFQRGVEVVAHGLNSTPIVPVYLDGLWGHPLSLRGGRPFASRLKFRHAVTIRVGEPFTGLVTAAQLRQRVLELGTEAAALSRENFDQGSATLPYRFLRAAKHNWSSAAIADSTGKQLTYGQALTASLCITRWLRSNCREANIGLLFPASAGGALANLGVTLANKVAVNLNFTAGEDQLRYAIRQCAIGTILTSRAFVEKAKLPDLPGAVFLEDLLESISPARKFTTMVKARLFSIRHFAGEAKPADLAAIVFSSGSTGTPKGVMLSHWNLLANAEASAAVYSVDGSDCILGALPFFHSFGYTYTLWFPLLNGFKTVFHSNPTDAKTIGELAAAHRPTLFLSTPTFCLNYLRKCTRERFASIRHLLVGAEKLQPSLAASFQEKFGVTLLEGYGCTEMGPAVSVNLASADPERNAYKPGSVGRPLPHVSVRIVDPETRAPLAEGETGLLLVNGPGRMLGYLGDESRTAQALHAGYYVTGDLARVDAEGFLYIVDRLSRFSKIAGEMVPHIKIEDALRDVLGDGHCAVTGVPDERRGERLAVLYVGDTVTTAQMIRHLEASGLPALWIPKRDQFRKVTAIPVLGTGKVDLKAVRAMAMEAVNTDCAA